MSSKRLFAVAVIALCLLAACQRGDRAAKGTTDTPNTTSGNKSTGAAYGDSLVIHTTDGTMKLGLMRDTVFMGLTDSVLAVARTDMARDTEEKSSAFSGAIERFVKKSVSSALQSRLKYPLVDIDSVTYQNGAIKFAYRDRRTMTFEDVAQNGRKALQSFSPEDAQKFVTTVNSAIRSERGGAQ